MGKQLQNRRFAIIMSRSRVFIESLTIITIDLNPCTQESLHPAILLQNSQKVFIFNIRRVFVKRKPANLV